MMSEIETLRITEYDLNRLMDDEETAEATFDKYYEPDDRQPFSTSFRLRPNVEIVRGEQVAEAREVEGVIMNLATRFVRRKRLKKYKKQKAKGSVRLVSEGDSWFQHPLVKDTIDHMSNHFAIRSLGAAGSRALKALPNTPQRIRTSNLRFRRFWLACQQCPGVSS